MDVMLIAVNRQICHRTFQFNDVESKTGTRFGKAMRLWQHEMNLYSVKMPNCHANS